VVLSGDLAREAENGILKFIVFFNKKLWNIDGAIRGFVLLIFIAFI
jgi:hypothetical protein